MFSPDSRFTVYDRDIWWRDQWDPFDYGMEYDFSRPFFEQFNELLHKVPLANLGNTNMVNSDYCNHSLGCRNCYLIYASVDSENVAYSTGALDTKDSLDLYKALKSEWCYENVLCGSLFNTHFSYDSDECLDSMFLVSCLGLKHCLGCVNLRHKTYCIFNQQFTKEEYEKKLAEYDLGSNNNLEKFKSEFEEFLKTQFRRFAFVYKSKDVTGDNVMHSKNSKMIFDIFSEAENCKYLYHGGYGIKESYDGYGVGLKTEFLYEGVDVGAEGSRQLFSVLNHTGLETHYTYMCYGCKFLFGCVGVRNHDYAILNKKYTKEEYEKLLPKVIEHMNSMPYVDAEGRIYKYGEFFPPEFSPFTYNETIAQEYYPLTKAKIEDYGLKLKLNEDRNYEIEIKAENLPDHIKDANELLIGKVIGCLHKGGCDHQCTEAFKIRPSDLQFYKKINVPLPRLCPNCRHFQRLKRRNPMKLWHRACMCKKTEHEHSGKCLNEFETSYAPERPEIIYCEKCYQREVY